MVATAGRAAPYVSQIFCQLMLRQKSKAWEEGEKKTGEAVEGSKNPCCDHVGVGVGAVARGGRVGFLDNHICEFKEAEEAAWTGRSGD